MNVSNCTWIPDCRYTGVDTLHWLEDAEFLLFINGQSEERAAPLQRAGKFRTA